MKTITLEIETEEDFEQLRKFVENLGIKMNVESSITKPKTAVEKKLEALEKTIGTVNNAQEIPLETLRRINLYD